jgi:hypothetical protein
VKTVNPRERGRSQIAYAIRSRQRGDVQQQARSTIFRRKRWRNHERAIAAHVRPACSGATAGEPSALFTIFSASLRIAFRWVWLLKLSA